MIPQVVPEFNTNPDGRGVLRGQLFARVDVVSLLRQLCGQVGDDALRGELGDALVLDAYMLRQKTAIDLDAASIRDDQAPGHVCCGCLQRTEDATRHYWEPRHGGPGEYHLCWECETRYENGRVAAGAGIEVPKTPYVSASWAACTESARTSASSSTSDTCIG